MFLVRKKRKLYSIKKKVEFTIKGDSLISESENNKESKIDTVSVGSSAQNASSIGTSANDEVEKQIDDKKTRKKTIVVDVGSVSGEKEQELHFKIRCGSRIGKMLRMYLKDKNLEENN